VDDQEEMEGQFNLQALVKKVEELLHLFLLGNGVGMGWGWGEENLQLICVDLNWDSWEGARGKKRESRRSRPNVPYFWKPSCSIHPVHKYAQSALTYCNQVVSKSIENSISHYISIYRGYLYIYIHTYYIHICWVHFLFMVHFQTFMVISVLGTSPKGEDVDSDDGLHDIVKPKKKKPKKEKAGKNPSMVGDFTTSPPEMVI
jgi:hypothetical protein